MSFGRKADRLARMSAWAIVIALGLFTWFERRTNAIEKNVAEQLVRYSPPAGRRLARAFIAHNVSYPPRGLALLGFKEERVLEVWALTGNKTYEFVKSYPILAASGKSGPKLREGDCQVPEGIYCIESLNANSHFHLALRIGYPNNFDRLNARRDGRKNLGGDIMIHGGNVSSGCLAMGDEAAEDLFVLAARTGIKNIVVILSPVDFRRRDLPQPIRQPAWVESLYTDIKKALTAFPTTSEVES